MNEFFRTLRSSRRAAALAIALAVLLSAQLALLVAEGSGGGAAPGPPSAAAKIASYWDEVDSRPARDRGLAPYEDLTVEPRRTTARKIPKPPALLADPLAPFRGLGSWVDTYDYAELHVAAAVRRMAAEGVNTIFVQTGRYDTQGPVDSRVGDWIVEGHRAGMRVVGWYLPGYRNVDKDVRRTVAVKAYRVSGHRFDAIGVDIEFKALVRDTTRWNARVVRHIRSVRERIGDFPMAAITPPPLQMELAPSTWAGFPWRKLGASSDVMVLMDYWSYRDCKSVPDHCAGPYTAKNVKRTRSLTKRPVHAIGGVGGRVSAREVKAFVRAAKTTNALGASLYDFRTTHASYWRYLGKLAI